MADMKIVRGNTFALRVEVTAQDLDGNVIEDFDLSACTDIVAKLRKSYRAIEVDCEALENNYLRVVFNAADQHIGNYGLEVTGIYDEVEWRFYNTDVFDIVESNEEASIPESAIIDDDYYAVSATVSIGYGEMNVIESVSVNGTAQTIADKNVNIVLDDATTDAAGLMSATDKTKLDEIDADNLLYFGDTVAEV